MKICVVGDPHGAIKEIKKIPLKDVDLILVPGDLGKADLARKMAFEEIEREKKGLPEKKNLNTMHKKAFMEIYNSALVVIKYLSKFAPVYTIYGNVEHSNTETKKREKKWKVKLPYLTNKLNSIKNVKVINDKLVKFGDIRIGGLEYFVDTNWIRDFRPSDYKKKMKKAKKRTDRAKKILKKFGYVDILLCHQPPYGYLDKVTWKKAPKHWQGKNAGSEAILSYIKKHQPKYAFCGHIHEGKGKAKIGKTRVHNVGLCGDYVMIDFDERTKKFKVNLKKLR